MGVTSTAFAVFQILDRRNWTLETAQTATHPPPPTRVKYAYARALERGMEGLTEEELAKDIMSADTLSHAIMSVGFDTYPDLDWLKRLNDPAYDAFMLEVIEEVPAHTGG